MSNETTSIVLTTIEVLKLRKAGWDAGWRDAEIWQEQHIDAEVPARMPDYTRGELEVSNFIDTRAKDVTSDDDQASQEIWQAYLDHVESILDDAAVAAWNEWRDQHCDEDGRLIVDE
jgi:hypothetical protein